MAGVPKSVLLIGGAGPVSSSRDIVADALAQAHARGLRTCVITSADLLASAPAVAAAASVTAVVDPDDPAACVRWAQEQAATGDRFDVVLGLRDAVLPSVAAVSEALGVPGNSPAAVRRSQHKDECRRILAAAGLPQPAVRLCASAADALAFAGEVAGPWVVKPRDGQGSEGVYLARDEAELRAAAAGSPPEFLVEEFVSGPEYSAEGVFLRGVPQVLALTAKETAGFVEVAHTLPAELPGPVAGDVSGQVRRATAALGLSHGVFHIEFWVTTRGVVLGEVHPRPGGDWIHRLLGHAVPEAEMFGLIYDDQLTGEAAPPAAPSRAATSRYFTPPPGRLREVGGWGEVVAHPEVLHAELTVRPGEVITPVHASGDRCGLLVVGGDTVEQARKRADELMAAVRFEVEAS